MATHTLLILVTLASLLQPAVASPSSSSSGEFILPPLAGADRSSSSSSSSRSLAHAHLSRRRRSALSHDPHIQRRQVQDVHRAAKRWENRDEIELARRASPSNVPSTSTCQGTVGAYGQCGGIGYSGDTCCTSGWTCTVQNDYYSQCTPAASTCSNAFYAQCGGIGFSGSTCCPSGSACVSSGAYYSSCVPGASSSTSSTSTTTAQQTTTSSVAPTTSTSVSKTTSTVPPSSSSSSSSASSSTTSRLTPTATITTTTTSTTSSSTPSSKTSTSSSVAPAPSCTGTNFAWSQCGGSGWSGATCCPSGYYCQYSNAWYSQCVPGSASSTTTTTTTTSARSSSSSSSSTFSTVTRSSSTSASSTSSAPTASASASTCSNAPYDTCGGILNLLGDSCCPTAYTCQYYSLFSYTCQPAPAATSTATSTSSGALPSATSTSSCKVGGSGSDGCTPYTVTALGVTLPSGYKWQDGGHVNYRAYSKAQGAGSTQSFGVHFESLNNQPSGVYIGKTFYDFSGAAAAFPGGWCVSWVQVDVFNQHFGEGGQAPICTA